jgi:hypothetical protein
MITFDATEATERVVRLVREANDAELAYGLTWYADAHAWVASLAAEHGRPVDDVAAIVAAISPQTSWPDNQRKTEQLLTTGETYGLRLGVDRAKRVLAGEDPDAVLGGPKVRAFWRTLADPAGANDVVVDRHAADAVLGYVSDDVTRKRLLERKGGYDAVADVYRSAARLLALRPHVVQGVVWAVWRNRYGRFHYQHHGSSHDQLRPATQHEGTEHE